MSTTAILVASLAIFVTVHARFLPPILPPVMPVPMIGPIHPPLITPFIRPFIHPIVPIFRQRRVATPSIPRPRSKPFVIETPRFLPREEDPFIINIVENRDPVRDVLVIEDKRQPMVIERPRYIDDAGNGDISIDGNVYISDPYAANDLQRGASVEQVLSRSVGSGNLYRGDADHPLPVASAPLPFNRQVIDAGPGIGPNTYLF